MPSCRFKHSSESASESLSLSKKINTDSDTDQEWNFLSHELYSPMEEQKEEQAPCTRCGEMTDNKLADVFICQACYEIRSSCCPEFGPDDLTKELYEDETED